MSAERAEMMEMLKATCIPVMRALGFKGSFPCLYRDRDEFVALVEFQFHSAGGSFCVNLGYADPDRRNVYFKPETQPKALKISQTSNSVRLGAIGGGDHWFCFGQTSYGDFRGTPRPAEEIAATCSALFVSEAEAWWTSKGAERPTDA
jgi:Domain of unknown function (DUF4304)